MMMEKISLLNSRRFEHQLEQMSWQCIDYRDLDWFATYLLARRYFKLVLKLEMKSKNLQKVTPANWFNVEKMMGTKSQQVAGQFYKQWNLAFSALKKLNLIDEMTELSHWSALQTMKLGLVLRLST